MHNNPSHITHSDMLKLEKRKIHGIVFVILTIILLQYWWNFRIQEEIKLLDSNRGNKLILIWKYGESLEDRHIHRFHPLKKFSPWENCSVTCQLTYSERDSEKADAVLFHIQRITRNDAQEIARWSRERRRSDQIWVFLTDESPVHTSLWPEYDGLFNWSMTYRSDSDVWVPYGRTIKREFTNSNDGGIIAKKKKFVAIMGSHCRVSGISARWVYARKLSTALGGRLDTLGACLGGNRTACPGHFKRDCTLLSDYKFYLAFENSNCREYLTEKVFWNAYEKLSVPVIMGASRSDCQRLLPPHSYIHVDDFPSPEDLANYLEYLDQHDEQYSHYHAWRDNYSVINEHGYFGSTSRHYCRLCEALHSPNIRRKYYHRISHYWHPQDCVIRRIFL